MSNNDLPTIDQLKDIKEQYCKYRCPESRFCFNDKECQINNFIEELYQNKIIGV